MKKHERFIEAHPQVKAWLKDRPQETKRNFASHLERFCKAMKIEPEEWRQLDKFKARDVAWKYVQPKIGSHPAVAKSALVALKSFYRNLKGETLPLDSGRGGKHHLHVRHPKKAIEHIPDKAEMYRIVDMASSLRDKSILLTLFQSGVRVNVLEHLTYGDIADQLNEDIITLKVTGDLDHKLRSRDIPFYYTFLNGEGAETLRQFCKVHHKDSKPEQPLFATSGHKHVDQRWIWAIVKMCVERAGLDPQTIWTHTIRKAFRKIVRQTNIDDEDKEQLMGHVMPGSREAYFDRKDLRIIREAYLKCNFTREQPQSEVTKLRKQLETSETKRLIQETRLETLESQVKSLIQQIKEMTENS